MGSIRSNQVTQIRSEYVTTQQTIELRKKKRRKKLFLRLIVFALFMGIISASFLSVYHGQDVSMQAKVEQKAKLEKQLALLKHKNQSLNTEIKRLHDKNYVGELARKDLLLSKPNETIFTTSKH